MLNLLPEDVRGEHRKRVYKRATFVWGIASFFVCLIGFALLIPAYSYTTVRIKKSEDEIQSERKSHEASEAMQAQLGEYKIMSRHIQRQYAGKSISEYFGALDAVLSRHSTSTFDEFSFNRDKAGMKITVNGSAPSREDLITLVRAFEADPLFEKATIPISDLTGRLGVFKFTLTLEAKP
jgi:hypothetical protein